MNVEFLELTNKLIIKLTGELDHHAHNLQKSRIEMKLSTNLKDEIVFDLNGLSFMDSSAISLIYGAYKIATEFEQKVSVICENEKFVQILLLSGIDEFVEIKKECLK